jgi:dipeptidyl aminopeptidase/acylaminoacyl peptidase
MGAARLIDWADLDGTLLHGAVLLPSGYQSGKAYPLLVYVYPRNLSDQITHFGFGEFPGPLNLQLFATRGYVVLLPDVPSQRTYGMAEIANAVLTGVSKLVDLGIADPQRIGVMGHSAGGYATAALLVQTHRFKAAVELDGITDYASHYGRLDRDGVAWSADEIGQALGGGPWEFPFRYVWNSPIYFLDRVQTPLLAIHGSMDASDSPSQSDEIFVGLRHLGKQVVYAKYEGETHVPRDWSFANQRDLCQRILAWFDEHLKADPSDADALR